jgi:hypothetical protein
MQYLKISTLLRNLKYCLVGETSIFNDMVTDPSLQISGNTCQIVPVLLLAESGITYSQYCYVEFIMENIVA